MDDLTQVYQSGVRAQVIIPGVPVRDGINIINIGTLYSQSFHAFGGSDGYDELQASKYSDYYFAVFLCCKSWSRPIESDCFYLQIVHPRN